VLILGATILLGLGVVGRALKGLHEPVDDLQVLDE
jgi:hypothetical protein